MQDELKNLLFGADQGSQYGNQTEKKNSPLDVDEDQILEFEEDYSDRRTDDPDAPLAVRLSLDIAFMLLLFHVAGGAETKTIQKWSSG